jgi:AcrR family transcriptional regulator
MGTMPGMITAKGRATRDRIVQATATLMYEHGVGATTTEDVCAAAGVSSSQLYHYFADKRALTRAVIDFQTDVVLGVQEPLLGRFDSLAAVRAWADVVIGIQRALDCRGCPLGLLAGELSDHDEQARQDLANGYRRWQRAIRSGLAAMVTAGELRADADVDLLATAVLTSLQGGLLMARTLRATTPLEQALAAVIDHIGSFAPPRRRAARQ